MTAIAQGQSGLLEVQGPLGPVIEAQTRLLRSRPFTGQPTLRRVRKGDAVGGVMRWSGDALVALDDAWVSNQLEGLDVRFSLTRGAAGAFIRGVVEGATGIGALRNLASEGGSAVDSVRDSFNDAVDDIGQPFAWGFVAVWVIGVLAAGAALYLLVRFLLGRG